jgi:arylsulfatase A-like enzyme
LKQTFPLLTDLLLAPLSALSAASPPDKPNIILIMSDDVGIGDIRCYGGPFRTPHIDSRSFAAQIKGAKGTPREWCYVELRGASYARDARYKLTNQGQLFDLKNAPWEETLVAADTKDEGAIASRAKLQTVLDEHPAKDGRLSEGKKGKQKAGKKRR